MKKKRKPQTEKQRKEKSEALLRFWNSPKGKRQKKKTSAAASAKWTLEARAEQSTKHIEFWKIMDDDEYKRRCALMSMVSKAAGKLRGRKLRALYKNDPFYGADRLSASFAGRKMSLPEEHTKDILYLLDLPYEFVGDGKLMIGRYCPDFVRVDAKAIIDVFGDWHSKKSGKMKMTKYDKKRIEFIKSQGFAILVVWQSELLHIREVADKISKFDEKVLQKLLKIKELQKV